MPLHDFNYYYGNATKKNQGTGGAGGVGGDPGLKDFNYYYANALRDRGNALPTPAPTTPAATPAAISAGGSSDEGRGPKNPLEWVIDILSRGMYGGAQFFTNAAEEGIDAIKQLNAGENPVGAMGGALGDTIGRSLFGPDSVMEAMVTPTGEQRRTFSDVIEQTTDKAGAAFDPNYVDRIDNVAPTTKGPVGLLGDIFLDPLTYVPGAVISKPFSIAGRTAWHGGQGLVDSTKSVPLLGRATGALPGGVKDLPGLRALGYKRFATGMREYDKIRADARAAAQQGSTPPGAAGAAGAGGKTPGGPTAPPAPAGAAGQAVSPAQGAAVAQAVGIPVVRHVATADGAVRDVAVNADEAAVGPVFPAQQAAPEPPVGPAGVVARSEQLPDPNPFKAVEKVADLSKTPVTRTSDMVDQAVVGGAAKTADPNIVTTQAATPTAYDVMSQADVNTRRAEAVVPDPVLRAQEEAHAASNAAVRAEAGGADKRAAKPSMPLDFYDWAKAHAKEIIDSAPPEAGLKSTREMGLRGALSIDVRSGLGPGDHPEYHAMLDHAKRMYEDSHAAVRAEVGGVPTVDAVVKPPMPQGAMEDLVAKEATYQRLGNQAKFLIRHSGAVMHMDEVADLLKKEAQGVLTPAQTATMAALRDDAARGMRAATETRQRLKAVKSADDVPKKKVEDAGPRVTLDDLYGLIRKQAPYLDRIHKFVAAVKAQVGNNVDPFAKGVVGRIDYAKNGDPIGVGIFSPKYDALREDAMHHWLSVDGDLAKYSEDLELELPGGVRWKTTVTAMREHVDRVKNPANAALYRDLGTGRQYVAPEGMNPKDADITKALWDEFYARVTGNEVTTHGARESFEIVSAIDAVRVLLKYDYEKVAQGLGAETAAALLKTFAGGNEQMMRNHFNVLIRVQDHNLTPQKLREVLNLSKFKVPNSPHQMVRSVLDDMKLANKYDAYARHQKTPVEKAVEDTPTEPIDLPPKRPMKEGQEPTPAKAIPAEVPPDEALDIGSQPSNVLSHPVSREELLAKMVDIQAKADDTDMGRFRSAVVTLLLSRFSKDVLEPQNLELTTATGVKVTSRAEDSYGWRTDLWNMPKQTTLANDLYKLLIDHSEGILRAKGEVPGSPWRRYEKWKGTKEEGAMPFPEQAKFEQEAVLEMHDIADTFLSSLGVRPVIGTTVDNAIPLSMGDILHTIEARLADPKSVFGEHGAEVFRMLFFGAQTPNAAKVNLTNFAEALRMRLNGEGDEAVIEMLMNDRLLGKRGLQIGPTTKEMQAKGQFDLGQMPNNFNNPAYNPSGVQKTGYTTSPPKEGAADPWADIFPNVTYTPNPKGLKGAYRNVPGTDLANATLRLIDDILEPVGKVAINNGWRGANSTMEASDILVDTMSQTIVKNLAADPAKIPELIRYLNDLKPIAEANAARIGGNVDSADIAVSRIEADMSDAVATAKANVTVTSRETPGAGAKQNLVERGQAIQDTQRATTADIVDKAGQVADDEFKALLDDPEFIAGVEAMDGVSVPVVADDLPITPPKTPSASAGGAGGAPPKTPPPGAGAAAGSGAPSGSAIPQSATNAAHATAESYDIAARYQNEYLNTVGMFMFNTGKFFNAALGMPSLWQGLHSGGVLASSYLARLNDDLAALNKTHGTPKLNEAFENLRTGTPSNDPVMQSIMKSIETKMTMMWTTVGSSAMGHGFLGVEPVLTHLNSQIRKYFPPEGARNAVNDIPQFDLNIAKTRMAADPDLTLSEALSEQWRTWTVKDAPDFLVRMMSAAVGVAEHRAVVNLFDKHVADWGMASKDPKPGWAKPVASKDSSFIHFIDQDKFYPRELLEQLHHADIFVSNSRQIQGETGNWIRSVYMPLLNAWKRGMTINRPGHHLRTQIGDTFLTYTARGHNKSIEAATDAFKIKAVAKEYEDLDFLEMLNHMHDPTGATVAKHPNAGDVLFTGHLNGQEVSWTVGQAADALHMNGLKPTYITGEGLYENSQMMGRIEKLAQVASLERTKYGKFMGNFSQGRDHWTRAQHFQQIMRQELSKGGPKQFKNVKDLDDLIARASKEVKRWHPDASMLTGPEAKVMRLIFPFYSWMAKIMPAFFESFIRYPGRVMVMPKASYEMAVANGINPDAIYDPFPSDTQFPSYLENKVLGPQMKDPSGGLMGINPGIPQIDLLNQMLGGNAVGEAAGMLTPALSIPFELASESSFGGIPIKDTSDYLDAQIPGGVYAAGITGISPTGTLLSPLVGEGWWGEGDGKFLDERRQVREGNYQGLTNPAGQMSGDSLTSLLNFVMGISITGMNHANQRNFAQIEARNGGGG